MCVSVAVAKSAATVPSNRGSVAASWYSNVKLSAACLLQGCEQEGVVSQGETEKINGAHAALKYML